MFSVWLFYLFSLLTLLQVDFNILVKSKEKDILIYRTYSSICLLLRFMDINNLFGHRTKKAQDRSDWLLAQCVWGCFLRFWSSYCIWTLPSAVWAHSKQVAPCGCRVSIGLLVSTYAQSNPVAEVFHFIFFMCYTDFLVSNSFIPWLFQVPLCLSLIFKHCLMLLQYAHNVLVRGKKTLDGRENTSVFMRVKQEKRIT